MPSLEAAMEVICASEASMPADTEFSFVETEHSQSGVGEKRCRKKVRMERGQQLKEDKQGESEAAQRPA
jgi:hypothetical protein